MHVFMHFTVFLAVAVTVLTIGVLAKLKKETIACLETTVEGELTTAMTPETAKAAVQYPAQTNDYFFFKLGLGSLNALDLRVRSGAVLDEEGAPECLNHNHQEHARCAATLLQNFMPAATASGEIKFTRIGKTWKQLKQALTSQTTNIDDECNLKTKRVEPPMPTDAKTRAVNCIQKLVTGTNGLLAIWNQKRRTQKFLSTSDVSVWYGPATKKSEYRSYDVGVQVSEDRVTLFWGSANPDVPLCPDEYTEPDCDDMAAMRCANQLLFKHTKPSGELPKVVNNAIPTGKTWTQLHKAMSDDAAFVCK